MDIKPPTNQSPAPQQPVASVPPTPSAPNESASPVQPSKSTAARDWIIAILMAITIIGLPLAIIFIIWRQPKLSKGIKWSATAAIGLLVVGLVITASSSKSTPKSAPQAVETELKAAVKFRTNVGILTSYKVENNNNQAWKNCTFSAGTDYTLKKDTVEVSAVPETYSVSEFKNAQGKTFNPLKDTDHTLTIRCTVGDKELSGSYDK